MRLSPWRPALVDALRTYSIAEFRADLVAGVTVGLVALPLAMAFAIASGVPPQAGIYTAIIGGMIVGLLGGSRLQIAGPTGAFVVIIAGIIAKHGVSGLAIVTTMAGLILLVLGFTKLGSAVKFIPLPVVIGFTNGIAVLILSTQIKDFFGLRVAGNPGDFSSRIAGLVRSLGTIDLATTSLALASLVLVFGVPRVLPRVPGTIVALVLGTLAVAIFHLHVATIGSRFGGIPAGLPAFAVPAFRPELVPALLPSALTVAVLAAIESLLSAVVADSLTGDRHNSNAELVGQGVANLVVPLFGGIPVTGAIARTATNVRSGARTPVSGIVHAVTLLAIVLAFAPLASSIPLATLAAILVLVAYNMSEWREVATIVRLDTPARAVWLATCSLTIFADLTVAVGVGVALAAGLHIYRVSKTTTVSHITPEDIEDGREHSLQDKIVPSYVSLFRIHGPFLFGTTEKLLDETRDVRTLAPVVILRLRDMTAIDSTGLHALEALRTRLEGSGRTLLLCGARDQPARFFERPEFNRTIGHDNILPNVKMALERAAVVHASFEAAGLALVRELV